MNELFVFKHHNVRTSYNQINKKTNNISLDLMILGTLDKKYDMITSACVCVCVQTYENARCHKISAKILKLYVETHVILSKNTYKS